MFKSISLSVNAVISGCSFILGTHFGVRKSRRCFGGICGKRLALALNVYNKCALTTKFRIHYKHWKKMLTGIKITQSKDVFQESRHL